MGEVLPVLLGALVGVALASLQPPRLRAAVLPLGAVAAGALASSLNGELADGAWALFVSFDAAIAWVSAAVVTGGLAIRARTTT